jgi:outer membrane lipase/esterase
MTNPSKGTAQMRGRDDEGRSRRSGRTTSTVQRAAAVPLGAVLGGLLTLGWQGSVEAQVVDPALQPFVDESETPAQRDMAVSIAVMCPELDDFTGPARTAEVDELNRTCANLALGEDGPDGGFGLDADERNAVKQSLNGEELQVAQQRIGEIRDTQVGNIVSRLSAIRAGRAGGGLSLAGLNMRAGDRMIALAPGAYDIVPAQFEDGWLGRLGLFATGSIGFGSRDATGEVDGFDFDSQGVTIGTDYRFTDQFVAGLAVGYARFNADFDATVNSPSGQELESDGVQVSLFGSFFPTDELFVDGIASFGWNFYDSRRRIVIPSDNPALPPVDAIATGDFDSYNYGFALNAGYNARVEGFNVTPVVRVEYLRAEIDGFTERSEAVTRLTFGDQTAESLTVNLGVEADYPISTGIGIISPNVRAEWVHEFLNDPDGVVVRYAVDPTRTSTFEVTTPSPDRDYAVLGAGVAASFPAGWSAFVDYNTLVGLANFDVHTVNFGVRKSF